MDGGMCVSQVWIQIHALLLHAPLDGLALSLWLPPDPALGFQMGDIFELAFLLQLF